VANEVIFGHQNTYFTLKICDKGFYHVIFLCLDSFAFCIYESQFFSNESIREALISNGYH
jgi:hypothetical protein